MTAWWVAATHGHIRARALCAWALSLTLAFTGLTVKADDKVDEALRRATRYLLEAQDPATGAVHNNIRNENAMSSMAVLALASLGHQPGDPTPEGEAMRKAIAYVLRPEGQDAQGYFGAVDGSRMYGHGITTLMLSEMLGMGVDAKQDELIRDKCRKAIDLILSAQKEPKTDGGRGGWRYAPDDKQSDMSVTVWQVMALRSAKNAGLDVPKEAIDDAVQYIKRLYDPEGKRGEGKPGGFGYNARGKEASTTAEGLLALQVCGEYESEEVLGASAKLLRDGIRQGDKWFFYTTYYYAQGMYQRGGKFADEGKRLAAELILPLQSREGWWEGVNEEKQGGKVYATSLAVLSLAVKNHFLPIYQR
ncbi:MAG: hypothetical protein QOE70_5010 [Chthoniobacter sp.]|jgi:hypothetical protein|nr:hypothetical protein [Chthoniobacter sp.]